MKLFWATYAVQGGESSIRKLAEVDDRQVAVMFNDWLISVEKELGSNFCLKSCGVIC